MNNPPPSADVQALMTRIRAKTDIIIKQQHIADTTGFDSMGGAMGLQRLRRERQGLQARLPALALVQ